jgi:hypothetical protein
MPYGEIKQVAFTGLLFFFVGSNKESITKEKSKKIEEVMFSNQ